MLAKPRTSSSGARPSFDVREPGEWKAGRAPRAVHVPLSAVGARHEELPRDCRIVTVCRSGGRSSAAARSLRKAGYEVSNLKGGMKAWQREGLRSSHAMDASPRRWTRL